MIFQFVISAKIVHLFNSKWKILVTEKTAFIYNIKDSEKSEYKHLQTDINQNENFIQFYKRILKIIEDAENLKKSR